MHTLTVCEIFKSIQGESSFTGQVCIFIRLSGCNLACSYCDTPYSRRTAQGRVMSIGRILAAIGSFKTTLVEITGGEPLLQKETNALCRALLKKKYTVLVETNGSLPISLIDKRCYRIMDIKCPGSGMGDSFDKSNIASLTRRDECKFVISGRADFAWAVRFVKRHALHKKCTVIFSPNLGTLKPALLAHWIVKSDAPVRLGLQMHKILWPGNRRGR
ncbi:MAG: radical SAM protein [Chitinivibrionales bacterium]|nr:radical SAM protein [Chitinivibrionales bacterium]